MLKKKSVVYLVFLFLLGNSNLWAEKKINKKNYVLEIGPTFAFGFPLQKSKKALADDLLRSYQIRYGFEIINSVQVKKYLKLGIGLNYQMVVFDDPSLIGFYEIYPKWITRLSFWRMFFQPEIGFAGKWNSGISNSQNIELSGGSGILFVSGYKIGFDGGVILWFLENNFHIGKNVRRIEFKVGLLFRVLPYKKRNFK